MATNNYTPAQQSVITEALNLVQERAATEGDFMTSPSHTFDYFRLFYAGKQEREHFALMLLDSQHKVLECSVLFSGTIDGAAIIVSIGCIDATRKYRYHGQRSNSST